MTARRPLSREEQQVDQRSAHSHSSTDYDESYQQTTTQTHTPTTTRQQQRSRQHQHQPQSAAAAAPSWRHSNITSTQKEHSSKANGHTIATAAAVAAETEAAAAAAPFTQSRSVRQMRRGKRKRTRPKCIANSTGGAASGDGEVDGTAATKAPGNGSLSQQQQRQARLKKEHHQQLYQQKISSTSPVQQPVINLTMSDDDEPEKTLLDGPGHAPHAKISTPTTTKTEQKQCQITANQRTEPTRTNVKHITDFFRKVSPAAPRTHTPADGSSNDNKNDHNKSRAATTLTEHRKFEKRSAVDAAACSLASRSTHKIPTAVAAAALPVRCSVESKRRDPAQEPLAAITASPIGGEASVMSSKKAVLDQLRYLVDGLAAAQRMPVKRASALKLVSLCMDKNLSSTALPLLCSEIGLVSLCRQFTAAVTSGTGVSQKVSQRDASDLLSLQTSILYLACSRFPDCAGKLPAKTTWFLMRQLIVNATAATSVEGPLLPPASRSPSPSPSPPSLLSQRRGEGGLPEKVVRVSQVRSRRRRRGATAASSSSAELAVAHNHPAKKARTVTNIAEGGHSRVDSGRLLSSLSLFDEHLRISDASLACCVLMTASKCKSWMLMFIRLPGLLGTLFKCLDGDVAFVSSVALTEKRRSDDIACARACVDEVARRSVSLAHQRYIDACAEISLRFHRIYCVLVLLEQCVNVDASVAPAMLALRVKTMPRCDRPKQRPVVGFVDKLISAIRICTDILNKEAIPWIVGRFHKERGRSPLPLVTYARCVCVVSLRILVVLTHHSAAGCTAVNQKLETVNVSNKVPSASSAAATLGMQMNGIDAIVSALALVMELQLETERLARCGRSKSPMRSPSDVLHADCSSGAAAMATHGQPREPLERGMAECERSVPSWSDFMLAILSVLVNCCEFSDGSRALLGKCTIELPQPGRELVPLPAIGETVVAPAVTRDAVRIGAIELVCRCFFMSNCILEQSADMLSQSGGSSSTVSSPARAAGASGERTEVKRWARMTELQIKRVEQQTKSLNSTQHREIEQRQQASYSALLLACLLCVGDDVARAAFRERIVVALPSGAGLEPPIVSSPQRVHGGSARNAVAAIGASGLPSRSRSRSCINSRDAIESTISALESLVIMLQEFIMSQSYAGAMPEDTLEVIVSWIESLQASMSHTKRVGHRDSPRV